MAKSHVHRMGSSVALMVVLAGVSAANPAFAQGKLPDPSHWGASFSTTPSWDLAPQLKKLIQDDSTSVNIQGSEFEVGIVRGSRRGGDWGVSLVSKAFNNGSSIVSNDEACFQASSCLPTRETHVLQGVKLTGVEVHKFIRVANITKHAQVGLNIGGGIAKVS